MIRRSALALAAAVASGAVLLTACSSTPVMISSAPTAMTIAPVYTVEEATGAIYQLDNNGRSEWIGTFRGPVDGWALSSTSGVIYATTNDHPIRIATFDIGTHVLDPDAIVFTP